MLEILLADDSDVLRERMVGILSEIPGVEVVGEAQNGKEAVTLVKELKPDVVILDIRMQGGNGIDALKEVRKCGPLSVVIMFTNYPYPQYELACRVAGADHFFDKSTQFENLVKTIEQLASDSQYAQDY